VTEAEHPAQLIKRQVGTLIEECVRDFRVTIVNGPRQAGKTTLLRQLHAKLGGTFVTLDDADQRAAARDDPGGYLQGATRPMFIDEAQRAGDEFILAIKAAVDRDQRPGTFVLSGSTRFLTVPTLSESLAGRAALIELWPFSIAERVGTTPDFLDRVFDGSDSLLRESPAVLTRHEYLRLACTGGFPEVVARRSARSRTIWFRSWHVPLPGPRRPGGGLRAGDAGWSSGRRGGQGRRDRTRRGFPTSHDTAGPDRRQLRGRCCVLHRGAPAAVRGPAHRVTHLVAVGRCRAATDAMTLKDRSVFHSRTLPITAVSSSSGVLRPAASFSRRSPYHRRTSSRLTSRPNSTKTFHHTISRL